MDRTGTSDGAENQIHRQIAVAASAALRHVPPRQRQHPVSGNGGDLS